MSLRALRCEGCALRCRYVDFTVLGNETLCLPAPNRNKRRRQLKRAGQRLESSRLLFGEYKKKLWVASSDSSTWRYRRRNTVLGLMHEHKRMLWESATRSCCFWDLTVDELRNLDHTGEFDFRGWGVDLRQRLRNYDRL